MSAHLDTSRWIGMSDPEKTLTVERLLRYTPDLVAPPTAAKVAPLVLDVLSNHPLSSANRAIEGQKILTQFAGDLHDRGINIDPLAAALTRKLVDFWIATEHADRSDALRAQYRYILGSLGRHANPDGWPKSLAVPRHGLQPPYTDAEISLLLDAARAARPVPRRRATSIIYLSLGAGLSPTDYRELHTDHVVRDHNGVSVHIPGPDARTVPVLHDWVDPLWKHIRSLKPGLIASARTDRIRPGALTDVASKIHRENLPRLKVDRLRSTWMLDHLNRHTPIGVLRDAAGLTSLGTFSQLLDYAEPVDPAERDALLRGGR